MVLDEPNECVAANMNYTCLIVGGFLILETAWWFKAGKAFTAKMLRAKEDNYSEESH